MQLVMENTYPQVPIIAIEQGTIEGAWEKAIAERLEKDFKAGSLLPCHLLQENNLWRDFSFTKEAWIRVAYMIRATEPEPETTSL